MATTIEQTNVLDVYQCIAKEFDDTRYSVWKFVKAFLTNKEELRGVDIGCGNGKNMLYPSMVGVDTCATLLASVREKNPDAEVVLANCTELPFEDASFDFALGISVFHHLSTEERRMQAVCEMVRVMKSGAEGLFNFWSHEHQDRRTLTVGDNYISWKSKGGETYERYYHILDEQQFVSFLDKVVRKTKIVVKKVFNEQANWVVVFKKA